MEVIEMDKKASITIDPTTPEYWEKEEAGSGRYIESEDNLRELLLSRTPITQLSELLTELNRDRLVSDIMGHDMRDIVRAMKRVGLSDWQKILEQMTGELDREAYHAKTLTTIAMSESGDDQDGEADAESGEG
jgi:hypothetical protein